MVYIDYNNGKDVIVNDLFDVAEIVREKGYPGLAKFIKTQAMELIDLRALVSLLDNIQPCCHCKRTSDDSDDGK